jgi:hypothetical protein
MSESFACPCDASLATPPQNPPGLSIIAYRDTDYVEIRAALLTPLPGETQLAAWRPGAAGDLAVMMAEWFAYLGDIITFYNERIANEDYLGTATRASSVTNLIRLLGYRPQPGVGASVTLAALLQTGPSFGATITLPAGLQVTSKPRPGQPPQTFELDAKTTIAAPDVITATAPLSLLAPSDSTLLLAGAVSSILGGDYLFLRPRGRGSPTLVSVNSATILTPPSGPKQTSLDVTFPASSAPSGIAASFRLDKPTLSTALWTLGSNPATISTSNNASTVHLSGLVRSIQPGDALIFLVASSATQTTPVLANVTSLTDTIWDGTGNMPSKPVASDPATSIIIPHTLLSVTPGLPSAATATNTTLLYNFVEAATLMDQPVLIWPGPNAANPPELISTSAFPQNDGATTQVLVADVTGIGFAAGATAQTLPTGQPGVTISGLPTAPAPQLQTPLTVMYNLLPFTAGKTVASEVLGSGDPTQTNQSFQLAKSPLTYLRPAATLISTLTITVNGQAWTEVPKLFKQPPGAQVFVTSQDANQITTVMFGDGVNGARLPAGNNNVTATYRYGSGSNSPPAGALTTIATPYPGLRLVLNPVAAAGGTDPDPPSQIQTYAPRSVLTFGRAVSAFDYAAIAAQIAAGTRVAALWGWDAVNQRGAVTVYVADDAGILANVKNGLLLAGDPNRPPNVVPATPINIRLIIKLLITATADAPTVQAAIVTGLTDPNIGLFGETLLAIGQPIFNSQIAGALQSVPGYVAVEKFWFYRADAHEFEAAELHQVAVGSYFNLDPSSIHFITRVAGNG